MCRTPEQIKQDHIILQELDDFVDANNIDPAIKFLLRIGRRNFISGEQNKDDHVEILQHMKKVDKNPSLLWLLRYKTGSTLATTFGIGAFFYVIMHVIEHFVGFEELLTMWIP